MNNLLQEFCFETDDLKSLEVMLRTVIDLFFDGHFSYFFKEEPSFWPDGGDNYATFYDDMPFVVRHNKQFIIADHNETFGGAKFATSLAVMSDADKAAAFALEKHGQEPKATRLWIGTVGQYCKEKGNRLYFHQMVDFLMEKIKSISSKEFFEKFGDGFNDGFRKGDGNVGHGWRIETQHCPHLCLHISMVHIYYGK